jgi:flagellar basal body-associated protein FliL
MDLLIALVVFILGFMIFGSLFYAAVKFFYERKMSQREKDVRPYIRSAGTLRVNKSHNVYSFK